MTCSRFLLSVLGVAASFSAMLSPAYANEDVADLFEQAETNRLAMEVEIAIARAQADLGIISRAAAEEIAQTGNAETVSVEAWEAEYEIVRHRLVALLNVWRRSLSPDYCMLPHVLVCFILCRMHTPNVNRVVNHTVAVFNGSIVVDSRYNERDQGTLHHT